ncbi:MAG: hypothetical protein Kow0047_09290 [Anaerolineae bacterium]
MPLHPRIVHFPLALFVIAACAAFYAAVRGHQRTDDLAFKSLVAGWLLLFPTAVTGLMELSQLPLDDPRRPAVNLHITAFFATLALTGFLIYWRLRKPEMMQRWTWRWAYVAGVLGAAIVALWLGHTGGVLVYELGIGVR